VTERFPVNHSCVARSSR